MTSAATRRFFLVGFMGAGKTTLGSGVARELDLPFFDLDERIEKTMGRSIADIFAREGEPAFRRLETRALEELLREAEAGIVALGGGAFTVEANRALLRGAGASVWLDVPVDELLRRVDGAARPLWRSSEETRSLHADRARSYGLADHRLDLAGLGPLEARSKLRELLAHISDER